MAKKAKADAAAEKAGPDRHHDGDQEPGQDATVRDQAPAPAAAAPVQMENAMVQQILERQAVFGF